jgi:glyoxylase-like metal-dependent hydrolase (beta-lactamase superfamily II)
MKRTHFPELGLTVFESVLYRTNTAVLEWEGGMLVTDPNWLPDEVAAIRAFVDERLKGRELWLFFTHSDYDHIIGAGAFPEAQVLASYAFAHRTDPGAALQAVINWDQRHYISRTYAHRFPEPQLTPAPPGGTLMLAGRLFCSWPAPGHTADGLILLDPQTGVCLAGDYLSNVEFPFIYHQLAAYSNTLRTFSGLLDHHTLRALVPGHGDTAITQEEIYRRIAESHAYLQALQLSIREGADFPLNEWLARYPHPAGLAEEHHKNRALALSQQ